MSTRGKSWLVLGVSALCSTLMSCSSAESVPATGSSAASPMASGAGGSRSSSGQPSELALGDESTATPVAPAPEPPTGNCSAFSASAMASPVDVALLIDRSGSMANRWKPLMAALESFLLQLSPQGRLALQVFPDTASQPTQQASNGLAMLQNNGICGECAGGDCLPQVCATDADCGGASCNQEFRVCTCAGDQECHAGSICHRSWCDRGNLMIDLKAPPLQVPLCGGTTQCTGGAPCRSYGELGRATTRAPEPTADPKVYTKPIVPFTLVHADVLKALDGFGPGGGTPMAEALEGFSTYLNTDHAANPGRKSVLVLVTDGLPNGADGLTRSVASIAALKLNAIDTYLIGITSAASMNGAPTGAEGVSEGLKQLAAAGSDRSAFLVQDSTDTLADLKKTLGEIVAATAIQCEFVLPAAPNGRSLDLDKVSLKVTDGAVVTEAPFVLDAVDCDPANPGWHFDALPPVVAVPSSVQLCPALCTKLNASLSAAVEFSVSCEAIRPPPRAPVR